MVSALPLPRRPAWADVCISPHGDRSPADHFFEPPRSPFEAQFEGAARTQLSGASVDAEPRRPQGTWGAGGQPAVSTPQPPPPSQQYLPQLHAHLQQHTQQHLQAQQPSAEQVAAGPCGGNWVTVQMGNTAPNGMPAVLPGSANGMSNWPAPATTMPQVAVSQVAPGMQQVVLCSLTPGMMQQMSQAVNVQALLGAQMTGGLAGAMSGNMMPGMQPVMPVTGAMQPTMQPAIQGLVPVAWHNLISVPMPCASPAPSTKLSATPSASPSHAQPQRSQRFPEDGKRHEQHKRSGKGSAVDRPTLQSAAMECVKNDHIEQNEERPLPCPTGVFVDLSPLKACVI